MDLQTFAQQSLQVPIIQPPPIPLFHPIRYESTPWSDRDSSASSTPTPSIPSISNTVIPSIETPIPSIIRPNKDLKAPSVSPSPRMVADDDKTIVLRFALQRKDLWGRISKTKFWNDVADLTAKALGEEKAKTTI